MLFVYESVVSTTKGLSALYSYHPTGTIENLRLPDLLDDARFSDTEPWPMLWIITIVTHRSDVLIYLNQPFVATDCP